MHDKGSEHKHVANPKDNSVDNQRPTTVAGMLEAVATWLDATDKLVKALERQTGQPSPLSGSKEVQEDLRTLALGLYLNPDLDAQVYALLKEDFINTNLEKASLQVQLKLAKQRIAQLEDFVQNGSREEQKFIQDMNELIWIKERKKFNQKNE